MTSSNKLISDIDIGFEFGSDRGVRVLEGINAAKQMIENTLKTTRGERLRRPGFGSKIEELLFDPFDTITGSLLQSEVYATLDQLAGVIHVVQVDIKLKHESLECLVQI